MSGSNRGGRPKGSRNKCPVISISDARAAYEGVRKRALEGEPEDQRLLVQACLNQGAINLGFGPQLYPLPGGGLLGDVVKQMEAEHG